MPSRASNKPRKKKEDEIQAARRVVDTIIEKTERVIDPAVSAAAAALSKLGASKGGEARAKKLTAKRRAEIAKKAAATRWAKSHGSR
ncbi:MAG TPA: hypothetical protein VM779_07885 [Thermoanaerobaculia bacterium]|nr:hypothetical protein [Thermoanaerobaculia bacterium]